jgi:general secretion pathway protein M
MKVNLSKQFPVLAKGFTWFYGLSRRDQMALGWLLIALLVFFLYLLVWRPAHSYLARSRAEAEQAYVDLVWMKENELRARQLTRQNPVNSAGSGLAGKSLLSVISSSAQKFKIELQRFEPRGDSRVNVWLDKVSFDHMMLWIEELNGRYGVMVEQITVDQTDQPGVVSARMSFQI